MKRINLKTKFKIFLLFRNSAGFTLIEALVSMVILSVGILGLASSINSITRFQNQSKNMTLATMYTTSQLENIKRFATNEPTGGNFGFGYLVSDQNDGFLFLNGYVESDNLTRTASVTTADGFTTVSVLTIFPANAPATENFDNPNAIRMLDVGVTTSWVDDRGNNKSVQVGTVMHRRQYIQAN